MTNISPIKDNKSATTTTKKEQPPLKKRFLPLFGKNKESEKPKITGNKPPSPEKAGQKNNCENEPSKTSKMDSDEGLSEKEIAEIKEKPYYIESFYSECNLSNPEIDTEKDSEAKYNAQRNPMKLSVKDNIMLNDLGLVIKGDNYGMVDERRLLSFDERNSSYLKLSSDQKNRFHEIKNFVLDQTIQSPIGQKTMAADRLSESEFKKMLEKEIFYAKRGKLLKNENFLLLARETGTKDEKSIAKKILHNDKQIHKPLFKDHALKVNFGEQNLIESIDKSKLTTYLYNNKKEATQKAFGLLKELQPEQYKTLKDLKLPINIAYLDNDSDAEVIVDSEKKGRINLEASMLRDSNLAAVELAGSLSHEIVHAKKLDNHASVQEEVDAFNSTRDLIMAALNKGYITTEEADCSLRRNWVDKPVISGSQGNYTLKYDEQGQRNKIREKYQEMMNKYSTVKATYDRDNDGIVDEFSSGHGLP